MVKGKGGKYDPWVICSNPCCYPWAPANWRRSFRKISQGPGICKFCDTPFEIPAKAPKSQTEGSADSGWKHQNSKGRVRPDKPSQAPVPPALDGPGLCKLLKALVPEDTEKVNQIAQFEASLFPPKPKTPADVLKDSIAKAEKAQRARDHLVRVCASMQTSFEERCEQLELYHQGLQEHQAKLRDANAELDTAEAELTQLRLTRTTVAATGAPDPLEIARSFDPSTHIRDLFAKPEAAGMSPEISQWLQQGVLDLMQNTVSDFVSRIAPQQAVSQNRPSENVFVGCDAGLGAEQIVRTGVVPRAADATAGFGAAAHNPDASIFDVADDFDDSMQPRAEVINKRGTDGHVEEGAAKVLVTQATCNNALALAAGVREAKGTRLASGGQASSASASDTPGGGQCG